MTLYNLNITNLTFSCPLLVKLNALPVIVTIVVRTFQHSVITIDVIYTHIYIRVASTTASTEGLIK